MSSKVIVNLPPDGFQQKQMRKNHQEIVSADLSRILSLTSTDPVVRANQLEQNIKFLQEQHQIMLTGLHGEIETLRRRNRDLQFQIVFSKGVSLIQSSSSSSDEDFHGKFSAFSPDTVNVTPLQVEILERNISELRTNLSEARTRNVYLQGIVEEQKKKLFAMENEKLDLAAVGKKIGKENVTSKSGKTTGNESGVEEELIEKLEDADRLIRRLRRENEEQRKEIVSLRTSMSKGKIKNRRNDGNNSHRTSYYRNGQTQASRFPPLPSHGHWRHSLDKTSQTNQDREEGRQSKEGEMVRRPVPSLPYLRDKNDASTSTGYSNPAYSNYHGANQRRGFYQNRKQEESRPNGRPSRREQQSQQGDEER